MGNGGLICGVVGFVGGRGAGAGGDRGGPDV